MKSKSGIKSISNFEMGLAVVVLCVAFGMLMIQSASDEAREEERCIDIQQKLNEK